MGKDTLKHRKAMMRVRLVNEDGTPVSSKKIAVNQTRQDFLFGCGAAGIMPYLFEKEEEKKVYFKEQLDLFVDVFNFTTLHFYWGFYERTEGETGREYMMKAAKFYQDHNIKMKGHPLCWHTCCADWLLKYSNEEILKRQLGRIQRECTDYKGLVDMWDVINEVVIMPEYDRYDNAITRLCKEHGRVPFTKMVFDEAKKYNPDATLLLNDFNLSKKYEDLIEGCLDAGVPISAIGIQTHQHQGYMGKEKLYDILERFSRFGLPLHFTENTIISGDLMPKEIVDLNDYQPEVWPSTPEGEKRQAEELEEMYRILYEHPMVEAITGWDFVDGAWLGAPSGLLRIDNSPKPAYDMLKHLIKKEWRTKTELMTDEDGWITLEGFKGDYELRTEDKSAVLKLDGGSKEQQIMCR